MLGVYFGKFYYLLIDWFRPAPGGKSVRVPYGYRSPPRPGETGEEHLAGRLVGQALDLGRYMDERVVEAARREIAEGIKS